MPAPSSAPAFSRRIDQLTRLLMGLLLAAGVAGAVTVLRTGMPEPVPVSASALSPNVLQLPLERERISNDLVFRPLFWQERRPLEAPQQTAAMVQEPAGRLEDVVLDGVFSSGAVSGVVLNVRGMRLRLRVGEQLDGWELVSVASGEARFVRPGDNEGQPLRLVLERSIHE